MTVFSTLAISDEASMSSQRMLELVNAIHHRLSENGDKNKPAFGGKHINLVGEFLQHRLLPDDLDENMLMFYSPLFETAILTFSQRRNQALTKTGTNVKTAAKRYKTVFSTKRCKLKCCKNFTRLVKLVNETRCI